MVSLHRSVAWLFGPRNLWRSTFGVFATIVFIVVRACGYDASAVLRYAVYLALYVALPGTVALYAVKRGPVSLTWLIALALPTGFALEIFTFLGLSAFGAKQFYAWTPLGWAALAGAIRMRHGAWPLRVRVSHHHAGLGLGLMVAFLATVLMAASQMFAESPLAAGLPTRAIFHDWVYLVSRAGVIKHNWPLDDPSLSGTPLQYHYFMMVHAAATSWTTGIELSVVMLRLVVVPLGAVLVAQAYALGRLVARSPWGGVAAALLTVMAGEASLESSYGQPMFLGLFVRWLFVSPTFFFGMIFCGALLLAVAHCLRLGRVGPRHYGWLLLLGTAGTGAKGTLLPVLIGSLGLLIAWRWLRERRWPRRLVLIAGCLTLAFVVVYVPTMSSWRTGDAAWRPFHVFQLTGFWKEHFANWSQSLDAWLPTRMATTAAGFACAAIVFCGTCGIRLLAIPYLCGTEPRDSRITNWLGAFLIACVAMGLLMELNSYGELYLLLMMRLPSAVLTAAFLVSATRRLAAWWRIANGSGGTVSRYGAGALPLRGWTRGWVGAGAAVLMVALGMQTSLWGLRNEAGFREWWNTPANVEPEAYMRQLQEALLWVRAHTEPNAVLVSNACTPENMKKDHWGALDATLTGVHFYYSALSERRLWFEGPNYIMDTSRARLRASLASNFFYRGRWLDPRLVNSGPCYALVDHSLNDGARVDASAGLKVFSNSRFEIFLLAGSAAQVAANEPGRAAQ